MDVVAVNGSQIHNGIPISPRWLEIVTACWLALLLVLSLLFNACILFIFVRLRLISAFYNVLISALLVNNLSIALLAFPFAIVAELSRGWLVNLKSGSCDYYAFVVYFLGMSSMFLHTAIALTRYYVVALSRSITRKITVYASCWIVACCYCMSLVLALAPMLGLGSYGLEEHGTSCGLAWDDTRLVNKVYLLLILVVTFVIPLAVMVFCYGSIYRTVCIGHLSLYVCAYMSFSTMFAYMASISGTLRLVAFDFDDFNNSDTSQYECYRMVERSVERMSVSPHNTLNMGKCF